MTVDKETNEWGMTGNGVTDTLPYDNKIFADTDMRVFDDGVERAKLDGYTVTGVLNPAGGNVVFDVPPPVGVEVVALRDVPALQGDILVNNIAVDMPTIERMVDRTVVLVQQVKAQLGKQLRQPDGDPLTLAAMPLLSTFAGKGLGFTTDNPPVPVPIDGSVPSTITTPFTVTLLDDVDAPTFMSTLGISAYIQTLVDDVDAATARATLEVTKGTAAGNVMEVQAGSRAPAVIGVLGRDVPADKSTSYAIATTDVGQVLPFDTTAGALNPTLPLLSSVGEGFTVGVVLVAGANALTVSEHATDGGANLAVITHSQITWFSKVSGDWVLWTPSTAALVGMVPVAQADLSSSVASVDFLLPAGFRGFALEVSNWRSVSDARQLRYQLSTDGGATFISTGTYSEFYSSQSIGATETRTGTSTATSAILSCTSVHNGSVNPEGTQIFATFNDLRNANFVAWHHALSTSTNGGAGNAMRMSRTAGGRRVAADYDAISIITDSGANLDRGLYTLYGFGGTS